MLILGIDPGTATTGYGLIRKGKEGCEVLEFGLIETDKDASPGSRLVHIFNQVEIILERLKPDVFAIEKLFFATNAKTAMRVGQAQGVMIFAAAKHKVEVFEYAPGSIKKMVTGNGRADKKAVQKSVRAILGPKVKSKNHQKSHFDNSADALAIALCHALKTGGDINV